MIGILLALQVNNWNEGRIERRFEKKMLGELHTSLQNNIQYLDMAIAGNKNARQSCRLLLEYMESGLPYRDTLELHFSRSLYWFHPSLDNNAYESLKSYGLHLISNDSIRASIGAITEWSFEERLSGRQEEYFYGTVAPRLLDWFESYDFFGPMKPLDYEELCQSKPYKHILKTMIANRTAQINIHESGRQSRLKLARTIADELDHMK